MLRFCIEKNLPGELRLQNANRYVSIPLRAPLMRLAGKKKAKDVCDGKNSGPEQK